MFSLHSYASFVRMASARLALGGGFEIALLSDLVVCSDKATFMLPELNLGLFPGLEGTQHLSRLVGSKVAMEKILLARSIKAIKGK